MLILTLEEFEIEFKEEYCVPSALCSDTTIRVGYWRDRLVALKARSFEGESEPTLTELDLYQLLPAHPHVIQLLAEVHHNQNRYLLLEGVAQGLTLKSYCSLRGRSQPWSTKACLQLFFQLASGLAHLHEHNIIHHDFHNENILVQNPEQEVPTLRICDLGIAEIVDAEGQACSERRHWGAYACLAPEQRSTRNKNNNSSTVPITNKIDIYAWAAICSSILFCGRNAEQVTTTIPLQILALLRICQADDPVERPTAKQLVTILEYWLRPPATHNQ